MRNVHKISSGKVNNRPVVLAGDAVHTEDGLLAHNITHATSRPLDNSVVMKSGGSFISSERELGNASIQAQKKVVNPPDFISFASEDIDGEPTLYELEMGKMAEIANVSKQEEEEQEEKRVAAQKIKETKATSIIDKARAKSVKQSEAIKKSAAKKE